MSCDLLKCFNTLRVDYKIRFVLDSEKCWTETYLIISEELGDYTTFNMIHLIAIF